MAQTDGHYCLVKVLATKAGFASKAAEIIAYASEYVDHATLHKGIKIYNLPKRFMNLIREGKFEPTCTAHSLIEFYNLLFDDVQFKVLIPFHFLPAERYLGKGKYDYLTKFNSAFAFSLVAEAIEKIRRAEDDDAYVFGLISLGIALHTFLDTATHEGFSGRWDNENSINNFHLIDKPRKKLEVKIIPNIGHGEAGNYPDLPFVDFSYEKDNRQKIERRNNFRFLKASKLMFDFLRLASGIDAENFNSFRDRLSLCFQMESSDLSKRIKHWVHEFPEIIFNFSPLAWQNAAIGGELGYDPIESRKYIGIPRYRYQNHEESKLWLFFMEAALKQRIEVLKNLP